jgi:hypothetical protein
MVIKKNMFGFTIMLLAIVFFVSSFAFAADVVDAAVADFNYCPDGTMVESLADCSDVTDGLLVNDFRSDNARLLVSGDEYGFVTNIDAKATIKTTNGEIFFVDTKVRTTYLDKSSPLLAKATNGDFELDISCGVSDTKEIVCKSNHLENDGGGDVFCWGNNELRACPDVEIETSRGGGAGKVSIQDFKIESTSSQGGDGPESSIEAYYQGFLTPSTDPDDDSLALSYVWSVREEPSSSGGPSEDVRLSFSKIEIKYSVEDTDGGSSGLIVVDLPEMSVYQNSLMLTEILFANSAKSDDGRVCGVTSHLLSGGDCDDDDPVITPESKADAKKALDGFTRAITSIQSSLARCETAVCRQVSANADKRLELIQRATTSITTARPIAREIRSIVHRDIATLERCETDICRDVLSQEKQLLSSINDYLDLDADSDGFADPSRVANQIPDYLDVDDDGDGIPAVISCGLPCIRNESMPPYTLFSSEQKNGFDEGDKVVIRDYLLSLSELQGRDFGLSVALAASENPRVREVRYNNETNIVEVEHEEDVKLLGFIPVIARATTTLDDEGREETKYPWWATFATKAENKVKFKAGAELSKGVN